MLELRPLFDLSVLVDAPAVIGRSSTGERRMLGILGGRFSGRLQGRVLPGGADWQVIRSDGLAEIEAHFVLEADSGHRVEVRSSGCRRADPDFVATLAAGLPIDSRRYDFRTVLRFTADVPELAWLNGIIGIGHGERLPAELRIRVSELL